ncbi:MAG: cytochrome c maturation protein CcmE [Dehalococcoidia bacterium]|nr:cytochrome c maturation protein CcmE [Dehalococcoidia bacterium]
MNKKLVWLVVSASVVALVIVGGVIGLRVMGQKTAEGHITATEARLQGASLSGRSVRIAGRVVPGSIVWNPSTGVTSFLLADSQSSIEAAYRGAMPNGFRPGDNLAVEARYVADGKYEVLSIPSNALCNVCHS